MNIARDRCSLRGNLHLLTSLVICLFMVGAATAQDLEPRAFSPAPTGLNIALLAYGFSSGNIFFDTSLPIEDAEGELHSASAIYVRTFSFFGASAKAAGIVPYAWGEWQGELDGEFKTTSRTGIADPIVQFSVNFVGAPALPMRDFVTYGEGTIVGASLRVSIPVGQYYSDKLINLGTNRWMFRPRFGFSSKFGRWVFEMIGSVKIFTENPDAFGGNAIKQDPLWSLQADLIYAFKRGFWLGVAAGLGRGGQATVNGVITDTYQQNGRLGATLTIPVNRSQSFKLVYIAGLKTRIGADFDTLSVAYQFRWGGGF